MGGTQSRALGLISGSDGKGIVRGWGMLRASTRCSISTRLRARFTCAFVRCSKAGPMTSGCLTGHAS